MSPTGLQSSQDAQRFKLVNCSSANVEACLVC